MIYFRADENCTVIELIIGNLLSKHCIVMALILPTESTQYTLADTN